MTLKRLKFCHFWRTFIPTFVNWSLHFFLTIRLTNFTTNFIFVVFLILKSDTKILILVRRLLWLTVSIHCMVSITYSSTTSMSFLSLHFFLNSKMILVRSWLVSRKSSFESVIRAWFTRILRHLACQSVSRAPGPSHADLST